MTQKNGTQTFSLKSLSTEKVILFKGLDIYLIELPEVWDEEEISNYIREYQVTRDRDFIFYQRQINTYYVRFKNLAGEFNFCGSATLALAKMIFKEKLISEKIIHFRTKSKKCINSRLVDGRVSLELPLSKNKALGNKYFLSQTNVLIQQLTSCALNSIQLSEIKEKAEALISSPGAYCAFYLDRQTVHLRYFSPWYGRDEDFVTLSVLEHLGEFLHENSIYLFNQQFKYQFFAMRTAKKIILWEK